MRDERQRLVGEPVPHFDGALQSLKSELHSRRVFREHGGDGLAGEHLVPRLHGDDEADARVAAVVHLTPPPAPGANGPTGGSAPRPPYHSALPSADGLAL